MAAGNVLIYKESGVIYITTTATQPDGLANGSRPVVHQYPAGGELTASVVNTNEIKIRDSKGNVLVSGLGVARFRNKTNTAQLHTTATGLRDLLNGTSYFGAAKLESRIGTVESDLSDAESDITALKNATKVSTGDRGVFLDNGKGATASFMRLQTNEAKLQVGGTGRTHITSTETSPGIHKFTVNAGASGSEAAVEALRITGSSTANTKAAIETGTGTSFVANQSLTVNGNSVLKNLSFASTGSPHSVSFSNASVSGLSLAASAISSGTFSTARIPGLGSSKITSGTFADARISSSSVTQHAGDIDLADLGDVNNTTPTDGQVLTWDNANSYWKPAASADLSNTDVTLAANRSIDLNNKFFTIQDGSNVKLQYNPSTDVFSFSNGLNVNGDLVVTASSGMQSSQIKLREPAMGGSSGIIIKAPSTNLASDLTFVMPDADGTSGQVLQTDGSGNLSFVTVSGGSSSKVYTFHDAGRRQWSSTQDNYYHVGDAAYGISDNAKNFTRSTYPTGVATSSLIDDFHHNSYTVPADCTKAEIRGWMHTTSTALAGKTMDIYVYKLVPNNTTNATSHTATQVLNVQKTLPSTVRQVIAFDVDTSSAGVSAGDLLHVVFKPTGVNTTSTHYLNYTYTLTIEE